MSRVGPILLLLLISACSTGQDPGSPGESSPEEHEPRNLRVERLAAGAPGEGPQRPQVVVAPSAEALSDELGAAIPDSGEGAYLAAYSGEQPTGGHSVNVGGARLAGDRVTVRLTLKGPPEGAIVTQALTYPYVVAVVRDPAPEDKNFSFVDRDGRKLDWPVRRVRG